MLPCKRCNGNKTTTSPGFTFEGKVYPDQTRTCSCCNGEGFFPDIDEPAIMTAIIATKGKNKGKLRASMVSPFGDAGVSAARAYYCWRVARFHGGIDVRMPIMADLVVRGDPYITDLNVIADKVAKEYLGTNMAAALTWGRALGVIR